MNELELAETKINRVKRNQEIQQRVSEALLTNAETLRRFMNTADGRSKIAALRTLLWEADTFLQAEGLSEDARDRFIHQMIHKAPPKEEPTEAEHRKRMNKFGLELQGLSAAAAVQMEREL